MKVKQVMVETVNTVSSSETLQNASALMRTHDIGFLPVVSGDRILGVVTDRDMVIRALAGGLHPHLTTVREVMTAKAIHCYEDHTLSEEIGRAHV